MSALASKAMPDGFKWWLVASVSVLLFSLLLFVGNVVAGFVYFSQKVSPLWMTVVGVAAAIGVGLGFAGFFVLMAVAGWRSHKEARRVQVIPPTHGHR
jgi:hypothetical protein